MSGQLEQLLGYLERDGVTEVVLGAGKPIAMRTEKGLTNLTARPLSSDQLDSIVRGSQIAALIPEGDGDVPPIAVTVGKRRALVRIARRGDVIYLSLSRIGSSDAKQPFLVTQPMAKVAAAPTPPVQDEAPRTKSKSGTPRNKGTSTSPRTKTGPRSKTATSSPRAKTATSSGRAKTDTAVRAKSMTTQPGTKSATAAPRAKSPTASRAKTASLAPPRTTTAKEPPKLVTPASPASASASSAFDTLSLDGMELGDGGGANAEPALMPVSVTGGRAPAPSTNTGGMKLRAPAQPPAGLELGLDVSFDTVPPKAPAKPGAPTRPGDLELASLDVSFDTVPPKAPAKPAAPMRPGELEIGGLDVSFDTEPPKTRPSGSIDAGINASTYSSKLPVKPGGGAVEIGLAGASAPSARPSPLGGVSAQPAKPAPRPLDIGALELDLDTSPPAAAIPKPPAPRPGFGSLELDPGPSGFGGGERGAFGSLELDPGPSGISPQGRAGSPARGGASAGMSLDLDDDLSLDGISPTTPAAVSAHASTQPFGQPVSAHASTQPFGKSSGPSASSRAATEPLGPSYGASAHAQTQPLPPAHSSSAYAQTQPLARSGAAKVEGSFAGILRTARELGASDLQISAGRVTSVRVLGELVPLDLASAPLFASDAEQLLMPLLDDAQRAILDKVGYIDLAIEAPDGGRLRANISKHKEGLKGTFRLALAAPATLEQLGLPADLAKIVGHHQGLVIVAGPSGHGKTTTLAAFVDLLNSAKPYHILTIEDPIEIVHPRKAAVVSQREAGRHTASFARGLKASLREDPDVIVIGELRDRESVEIALTAAETGHLVIATMSTPSAAKTIDRLIDMFPPEEHSQVRASIAGALRAIVAQRLLPKRGGGIVPAVELVTGVLPLAVLIREDKLYQLPNLMQRGRAFGMIRFDESLLELVRSGQIDEDVALSVAESKKDLAAQLRPAAAPAAQPKTSQLWGFGKKGSDR